MKRLTAVLLTLAMVTLFFAIPAFAEESGFVFSEWNPDAPALKTLIEYVEDVTNETSPNFIPVSDRIATFDMDGTLCAELYPTYLEYYLLERRIFCDPAYTPDEEMLEFGRMLRDHALDKSFPDGMDVLHATHAAKAYAGMTLTQFQDFVTQQLVRDTDGFEGMTNANTFYLPMIEVVEYLQENGFKVYVCSGSDRFLCRTYIEGHLDIPYEQIIGMDVDVEATNEDGADGLKYVYTSEDNIVRTDRLLVKNLKMNKVKAIVREIGRQPVLSFGNSSGDVSMHNYTIFNNRYRSAAFMLIADDGERDYGSAEKVQPLKEKWEESGYHVISMKDDFRTIYGDDVVKTGSFHWLNEFADKEEPAAGEETETAANGEQPPEASPEAEASEQGSIQYVLYLGTNDKDTDKPVFTQAEALEQAKDILIRHFGGYTIQEAHGGWIDSGKKYQEYTLVIYLSDTTLDKIHAAADEMIETFRQNSVLIQENPTKTEFYSGKQAKK
jgi:phosphoserine phosphatase